MMILCVLCCAMLCCALVWFNCVRPGFSEILQQLLSMRAADPAPTPAVHVRLRLRGPLKSSSGTPSAGVNGGVDTQGRLAAVTGGASGGKSEAPLIVIGSTAHVRVLSSWVYSSELLSVDLSVGLHGVVCIPKDLGCGCVERATYAVCLQPSSWLHHSLGKNALLPESACNNTSTCLTKLS